jgi:hypothetical protein
MFLVMFLFVYNTGAAKYCMARPTGGLLLASAMSP